MPNGIEDVPTWEDSTEDIPTWEESEDLSFAVKPTAYEAAYLQGRPPETFIGVPPAPRVVPPEESLHNAAAGFNAAMRAFGAVNRTIANPAVAAAAEAGREQIRQSQEASLGIPTEGPFAPPNIEPPPSFGQPRGTVGKIALAFDEKQKEYEKATRDLSRTDKLMADSLYDLHAQLGKPPPTKEEVDTLMASDPRLESVIGISPENVEFGTGPVMGTLTQLGKFVNGLGQFLTSPQGIVEQMAALTPAKLFIIGKWTIDMLGGTMGETARISELILKPDPTEQDIEELRGAIINTVGMGLGAFGLLKHQANRAGRITEKVATPEVRQLAPDIIRIRPGGRPIWGAEPLSLPTAAVPVIAGLSRIAPAPPVQRPVESGEVQRLAPAPAVRPPGMPPAPAGRLALPPEPVRPPLTGVDIPRLPAGARPSPQVEIAKKLGIEYRGIQKTQSGIADWYDADGLTVAVPRGSPVEVVIDKIAQRKKEQGIVARIDEGIKPEHIQILVQREAVDPVTGRTVPGFLQIDEIHPELGNTFSSNPEQLNKLGFKVPVREDLLKLPTGRYSLAEANRLIGESKKAPPPPAAPPVAPVVPEVPAKAQGKRAAAAEFDRLVLENSHLHDWTRDLDVLHAGEPKGTDTASWKGILRYREVLNIARRNAAKQAGIENWQEVAGKVSLSARAAALPKLKEWLAKQKPLVETPVEEIPAGSEVTIRGEKYKAGATDPDTGEVTFTDGQKIKVDEKGAIRIDEGSLKAPKAEEFPPEKETDIEIFDKAWKAINDPNAKAVESLRLVDELAKAGRERPGYEKILDYNKRGAGGDPLKVSFEVTQWSDGTWSYQNHWDTEWHKGGSVWGGRYATKEEAIIAGIEASKIDIRDWSRPYNTKGKSLRGVEKNNKTLFDLLEGIRPKKSAQLLPGERQGDLITSTQTEDLTLVGEKGVDAERLAAEKAKAEQDRLAAEELAKKQQQQLPGVTPQAPPTAPTLIDDSTANTLRDRIRSKLKQPEPPEGMEFEGEGPEGMGAPEGAPAKTKLDPKTYNDAVQLGAYYIQKGFHKLDDFSAKMREDFGDEISDHVKSIYDTARITIEAPVGATAEGRVPGLQRGLRPPAERIITARERFTHPADESILPVDKLPFVDSHQKQGAARGIRSLEDRGGFLNSDGTGAGKTRQALTVADYYAKKGFRVIIVTLNETIKPDWKKNTFGGSYFNDAKAMGIPLKLSKFGIDIARGQIGVTTYYHKYLKEAAKYVGKDTILIFDEAHALKNQSARTRHGMRMVDKAGKVMFMSATPADKAVHIHYLRQIGILEGKSEQQQLRDLGMALVDKEIMVEDDFGNMRKVRQKFWIPDPNVTKADRDARFNALFDRMTESGAMIKREVSMDGTHVQVLQLTLPPEGHKAQADILKFFEADFVEDLEGLKKAIVLGHMRRQQEPFKIAPTVMLTQRELAAGRQVVIYVSRVNESEVGKWVKVRNAFGGESERIREVLMRSEGTAKSLRDALNEAGIYDIAEIHGAAEQSSLDAMADFQAGKKRVVIATMEAGGTGINLDDVVGTRPRSMIVVTAPFGATDNVQAAGRIWRLKTLSDANYYYLFGDTDVDVWNAEIIGSKMKTLGAMVEGNVKRLDITNPDWVSTDDFHGEMRKPEGPAPEAPAPGELPELEWKPFKTKAGKDKFVAQATDPFWAWWNANGKMENPLGLRISKWQGKWNVWSDKIPKALPETEIESGGAEGMEMPAGKKAIHFKSGSDSDALTTAYIETDQNVGVELQTLNANRERQLSEYANRGGKVFVDSGAFTAFQKGIVLDFNKVMERYKNLVGRVSPESRGNLSLVMPDVIGNQSGTLDLVKAHRNRIVDLINSGSRVILPIQGGEISLAEMFNRYRSILGTDNFTVGIPSKAKAIPREQVTGFLKREQPKSVHLLGLGDGIKNAAYLRAIQKLVPDSDVSTDATWHRSFVGKGMPITEARRVHLERMLEDSLYEGEWEHTEWMGRIWFDRQLPTAEEMPLLAEAFRVSLDDLKAAASGGRLPQFLEDATSFDDRALMWSVDRFLTAAAKKGLGPLATKEAVKTVIKSEAEIRKEQERQLEIAGIESEGGPEGLKLTTVEEMPVSLEGEGEMVRASEIIDMMANAMGRQIRIGGVTNFRHAGQYWPKQEIARIRRANSIAVAAHEMAHGLERLHERALKGSDLATNEPLMTRSEWVKRMPKAVRDEFKKLDYDPKKKRVYEGFAEFVRHLLTTGKADRLAPNAAKWFNAVFLKENPHLVQQFENIRNRVLGYQQQGPVNMVKSMIRFTGQEKKPTIGDRAKRAYHTIRRLFEDDVYDIDRIEREIVGGGKSALGAMSPSKLARTVTQKSAAIAREWGLRGITDLAGNRVGLSLREIFRKDGIRGDEQNALTYAVAKRAVSLYERAKAIDAGIPYAVAKAAVQKLETPERAQFAKEITDFNNAAMQYLVDSGVLDPNVARKMRAVNPVYIQFFRVFDKERGVGIGGRRIGEQPSPTRRIKGSGREFKDPIESMTNQMERFISIANKTRVARALVELAGSKYGFGKYVYKFPPNKVPFEFTIERIKKQLEDAGVDLSEADLEQTITLFNNSPRTPTGGNIVGFYMNGKRQFYELDPELYRGIMALDFQRVHPLVDLLFGKLARTTRLGATGVNPGFSLFTNLVRDYPTLLLQSEFNPLKATRKWAEHLARQIGMTETDVKRLWMATGGEIAQPLGLDRASIRQFRDEVLTNSPKRLAYNIIRHPWEFAREVFSVTEAAPRLAEFENTLREMGWKPGQKITENMAIEAAHRAAEVTVNFSRGGSWGRMINQIVAFHNPNIQGLAKFGRMHKRSPVQSAIRGLGTITAISVLNWITNHKDEDWKNLPPWLKYGFLNWKINDTWIRIPMPFEWWFAYGAMPIAALEAIDRKRPGDIEKMFGLMGKQMTPPLLPSAATPILEVGFGRSFFSGKPIEPSSVKRLPATERVLPYTTQTSQAVSKILSVGGVDVSPIQVDHILRGETGGIYTDLIRASEQAAGLVGERPVIEPADLPVVGRMFARDGESALIDEVYDQLQHLTQKQTTYKFYSSTDDPRAAKYQLTPNEADHLKRLQDAEKILRDYRRNYRAAPTRAERRDLFQQMKIVAKNAIN